MNKNTFFAILGISLIFLSACGQSAANTGQQTTIAQPTAPSQITTQLPTLQPTPAEEQPQASRATAMPTAINLVTATLMPAQATAAQVPATPLPISSPTALPEGFISGYWIQNTDENGLCSNDVRFISDYAPDSQSVMATRGQQVCQLGELPLERWYSCPGDPFYGFPSWQSSSLPGLKVVNGSSVMQGAGCYSLRPALAGIGGRCIAKDYIEGQKPGFECQSKADGLPFDNFIGYAIDKNFVEWFLSAQTLTTLGLKPKERTWQLARIIDNPDARFTVLSIGKDNRIFAGTNGSGLLVFDPKQEKPAHVTSADGLPGDDIRWIQNNADNCLLVATENGVGWFDGKKWHIFNESDGLPSNDVLAVTTEKPDDCSALWAATSAGPARWQQGSNSWQTFPDFPKDWELTGTRFDEFTTSGQGALKFIPAPLVTGAQTSYKVQDGLPGDQITGLAQGEEGIIVGTGAGATVWDGSAWSTITTAPVRAVSSSLIAAADGMWAYQDGAWKMISQEPVQTVAGGGWYATKDEVCHLATPQPVCPKREDGKSLSGTQVMDFASSGEVWVVDDQKHVWQLDPNGAKPDQFVDAHFEFLYGPMKALLAAPDGPFFGSNAGVYRTFNPFEGDPMRASLAEYTLADGYRVRVRDLAYEPTSDRVWIATDQGVFYTQRAILLEQHYGSSIWTGLAGLPTRDFTAVLPLSDGSVWLGTAGQGIIYFNPTSE